MYGEGEYRRQSQRIVERDDSPIVERALLALHLPTLQQRPHGPDGHQPAGHRLRADTRRQPGRAHVRSRNREHPVQD